MFFWKLGVYSSSSVKANPSFQCQEKSVRPNLADYYKQLYEAFCFEIYLLLYSVFGPGRTGGTFCLTLRAIVAWPTIVPTFSVGTSRLIKN
ncbi:MAG: hypothetical protein ACNS62_05845 [Candidatus Cyclobacteriaceae bacterium M3_2C_046]